MNQAMTPAPPRRHREEILTTIVAVALCAPLLHFLLVLLVPPAPPAYSLDAITSVLGSGIAVGELDVHIASPPSSSQQDEHDRALSLALADRLGVHPSEVRVVLNDVHAVRAVEEMLDQIVCDFTAALRLGDGTWRVVRCHSFIE